MNLELPLPKKELERYDYYKLDDKELASKDDAEACLELAARIYHGLRISERKKEEAEKKYLVAAVLGHPVALAKVYMTSDQRPLAKRLLKESVSRGHVTGSASLFFYFFLFEAMLELSTFYSHIRPFSGDIKKKCLTLVELSAQMGHPRSQHRMYLNIRFDSYFEGRYTPNDAFSMVLQSMLRGCEDSIHSVGSCYKQGYGVEKDFIMAHCLHFISNCRIVACEMQIEYTEVNSNN